MRAPGFSLALFFAAGGFLLSPLALPQFKAPSAAPARAARVVSATPASIPELDFYPAYFALDPSASVYGAEARAAFNPADPFGGLPQTEGYELVAAQCAACHSLRVVMQQALPPARWDTLLRWMVERQGMRPLEAPDRRVVLDYLTRHFGDGASQGAPP